MVARIWHGWTTFEQAAAYEALLRTEVFPSIERKQVKGYRKISLLKRYLADEVEFMTIMLFDAMDDVRAFAGTEYELAYVPEQARKILSRYDARSQHYEVVNEIVY